VSQGTSFHQSVDDICRPHNTTVTTLCFKKRLFIFRITSFRKSSFSFSALTLMVGDMKGILTIWEELCTSYSYSCHHSPPPSPLAPIKSRMKTFSNRLIIPWSISNIAVKTDRKSAVTVLRRGGQNSKHLQQQRFVWMPHAKSH